MLNQEQAAFAGEASRRGNVLVLAALLLVPLLAMVAFAVDIGFIVLVRTQLQVAADSSAMAAAASMGLPRNEMLDVAKQYAGYHTAGGTHVELNPDDVECGTWDVQRRTFTPSDSMGNAIRVITRTDATTSGESTLFFAKIFDRMSFPRQASAVAMANPRDIAFVVDLSGSMNNDTEPCWSTRQINDTFGPEGYANVGTDLMQQVYDDFGYGSFPGVVEWVGKSFGVADDVYAYANLTADGGPLTKTSIATKYRIVKKDSEPTRKTKGYNAIIDQQIARIMPAAKPTPDSSKNYAYWEKYLDYVIAPVSKSGRGTLPPSQDTTRITTLSSPSGSYARDLSNSRGEIGYVTYVQFMMDHGREMQPVAGKYTPLSQYSPDCPWHYEDTAGGSFRFPPREQPTHAARRALIAALQVVKERNGNISNPNQRDWVSIVTFDRLSDGGPRIVQPLTSDYDAAMQVCTLFQAVSDESSSTATETGMITARQHIRSTGEGGQGRYSANKIVVLLTDGMPNLYSSSRSQVDQFISDNSSGDFYGGGNYPQNASLMQSMQMQLAGWNSFPVGIGLDTDYTFMDRMARLGATQNQDGQSPRGSGNPAEYEQRLTDIFENIITNPKVRLVQ